MWVESLVTFPYLHILSGVWRKKRTTPSANTVESRVATYTQKKRHPLYTCFTDTNKNVAPVWEATADILAKNTVLMFRVKLD